MKGTYERCISYNVKRNRLKQLRRKKPIRPIFTRSIRFIVNLWSYDVEKVGFKNREYKRNAKNKKTSVSKLGMNWLSEIYYEY